jgi:hypothetical protein
MLQDGAERCRIGGSFDMNAYSTEVDPDGARWWRERSGVAPDHLRYAYRHQLGWLYIQTALAQQFAPVKHLVGIDAMTASQHRHGYSRLQRLFGDLPPLLL